MWCCEESFNGRWEVHYFPTRERAREFARYLRDAFKCPKTRVRKALRRGD